MTKIIVEICCGSADDVIQAKKAGADRVELNSCLFLGGLTPSIGELEVAKKTGLPIMTMVRPREAGFCYTDAEYETMLCDARALLERGADGIVFGFLHEDGTIDIERCKEMLKITGKKTSVFHRAFDVVPDWHAAMETLIDLGVNRILTSGQEPTVPEGADTIREMIEYAAGRIEILPGAGITLKNVKNIVAKTNCSQIHAAIPKNCRDISASGNPEIFFGGALYPPEDRFYMMDAQKIQELTQIVNP